MMAKYSMKIGGKEVGPASVYAPPHTMKGEKVTVETSPGKEMPYNLRPDWRPTHGMGINPNIQVKTSGIKMRGVGCATKGTMCRGPIA